MSDSRLGSWFSSRQLIVLRETCFPLNKNPLLQSLCFLLFSKDGAQDMIISWYCTKACKIIQNRDILHFYFKGAETLKRGVGWKQTSCLEEPATSCIGGKNANYFNITKDRTPLQDCPNIM